MVLDKMAACYGLTQVAFADAAEHLAGIFFFIFAARRSRSSSLRMSFVYD
jgi:hypothetical protein